MERTLGIYIHIPFCRSKCRYCDFCSFPNADKEQMRAYCEQLCRGMSEWSQRAKGIRVDTVYFGGGTPSLLPICEVEVLICSIRENFDLEQNAEISFECNPATANKEYFAALRSLGVNRLSMGLQSAVEHELRLLGRAHGVKDFEKCFSEAREAGFDNISVDLMYGIPDQTTRSMLYSADYLVSLNPEHISAYGLSVEEGTYFARHRNELSIADDDGQAEMYSLLCKRLAEARYRKYEISNFAREGRESRHNLRYWQSKEYLGFGVAAHSYFEGERFGNSRNIDAFLRGKDIVCERQALNDTDRRSEHVMLGLRLSEGIAAEEYKRLFGRDFYEDFSIDKYIDAGFMSDCGGKIAFTEKGILVSNSILADILP